MMLLRTTTVLLIMVALSACGTVEPKSDQQPDITGRSEMVFTLGRTGGNCQGCIWIAAQGEITATTPEQFKAFVGSVRAKLLERHQHVS